MNTNLENKLLTLILLAIRKKINPTIINDSDTIDSDSDNFDYETDIEDEPEDFNFIKLNNITEKKINCN